MYRSQLGLYESNLEDYTRPSFSLWGRRCVPRGTRTEGLCFFVKMGLAYKGRSGKAHKNPNISLSDSPGAWGSYIRASPLSYDIKDPDKMQIHDQWSWWVDLNSVTYSVDIYDFQF